MINLLSKPVHFAAEAAHKVKPVKKEHRHVAYGMILIVIGSTMATSAPHFEIHLFHALWDGVSYSIHGFGCAPIFKVIAQKFKVEI